jgi:ApaG protein
MNPGQRPTIAMVSYAATTETVTVTVRPVYLDEQSDYFTRRFVFAYFIRIENHGSEEVQLLRRHWLIRDSDGRLSEVEGEGVVGVQPVIPPGEAHEYSSYCILETFEGTMEGTFLMQKPNGGRLRAQIPLFHLRASAN